MVETKIDVASLKVQQCVYTAWYRFKQCNVRSCKNYSAATTTHCLAIDRAQPLGNKIISDAELHLFKFGSAGVSTRLISIRRKKAVTRVKAILILYNFIAHIRQKYKPDERYWSGKLVENLELAYPLRIMKLGYMNWMLPYLTSRKVYEKFAAKNGGECEAFKIHTLLCMTEMKFKALRKSIKTPTSEVPTPTKEDKNEHPTNHATLQKPRSIADARPARKIGKLVSLGSQQHRAKG